MASGTEPWPSAVDHLYRQREQCVRNIWGVWRGSVFAGTGPTLDELKTEWRERARLEQVTNEADEVWPAGQARHPTERPLLPPRLPGRWIYNPSPTAGRLRRARVEDDARFEAEADWSLLAEGDRWELIYSSFVAAGEAGVDEGEARLLRLSALEVVSAGDRGDPQAWRRLWYICRGILPPSIDTGADPHARSNVPPPDVVTDQPSANSIDVGALRNSPTAATGNVLALGSPSEPAEFTSEGTKSAETMGLSAVGGSSARPRSPVRPKVRARWCATWEKVRAQFNENKSYTEMSEWLNKMHPDLRASSETLARIIAAGVNGELER